MGVVSRSMRRTLAVGFVLAGALVAAPSVALGGEPRPREDEAAAAYDRGARAFDRGDHGTAATELARADELAPNLVALELALAAVVKTDDAVLGMTLAERAEARGTSKALAAAATAARRRFGTKVGRLEVVCPSPPACVARIDGAPFSTGAARLVTTGPHRVAITRDAATEEHEVVIDSGKTVQLLATRAPAPAPQASAAPAAAPVRPGPVREPEGGLSPTWFWVGTGVTVVLGGVSVVSGLDTISKHSTFEADRSNAQAAQAGQSADRRTTILLVATGVAAAATATLGLVLVRWRDQSSVSASISGGNVLLRAAF